MATNEVSSQNNTEGKSPLCACCAPKPIPGFSFFIPPFATMLDAALIYAAHGWPVSRNSTGGPREPSRMIGVST